MSLNGALNVGRSALAASQAALQVAGNNMANAATEGYHRRSVHLAPIHGERVGRDQFVGRGVELVEIRREVDVALQGRYRDAIGDEQGALIDQRFLSAIERLQGELSDHDLSTLVSTFFNSFSELANNPHDHAVRSLVIQQGQNLANRVADLDGEYNAILQEIDRELGITVERVNDLLGEIEGLNLDIAQTEAGAGEANALRDQRDLLIDELSQHLEVTVIEHGKSVDLLVNSIPIMLAGQSRGVELRTESVDGELEVSIRVASDGTDITVNSGSIGALLRQRDSETVRPAAEQLDTFAQQLILQVNRLHSQGQGQKGFESATGSYIVDDATVNLNHADSNLPFRIENGSFFVHVTHQSTGQSTSYRIDVDGDAMSLTDLIDEINTVVGVPNVTAGQDAERHFTLSADAGWEFSFSGDSSGALAALGVNTFFDGRSASSITVNETLLDDPTLLAAAANHVAGSNDTALAIADLQDAPVDDLGGLSLRRYWQSSVNELAVKTSAANTAVESSSLVREGLYAQIQVASGVSLDEEAINLLTFQRQFQAAARFITVIDETLQTLLSRLRVRFDRTLRMSAIPMTTIPSHLARVPNMLTTQLMAGSINRSSGALVDLQVQLSSGKRLLRPSDDPIGNSAVHALDDVLERRDQRLRNLSHADAVLGNVDAALGDLSAILIEAKGIAASQIGVGSDAVTRENQAHVIDAMLSEAINIANRRYQEVHLFGGTATASAPIEGLQGGLRYIGEGEGLYTDLGLARPVPITSNGEDAFGALSARVQGVRDLDPSMSPLTRLADLNGARGLGIALGSIEVDVGGTIVNVDLTDANTIQDVTTALEAAIQPLDAGAIVQIDPVTGDSIEITGNALAITISDPTSAATAADLGLDTTFPPGGSVGADVDPRIIETTPLASLAGVTYPLGTIRIENMGQVRDLDLSGAVTVEDLVNLVEGLDLGVRVTIAESGDRLDFVNELSGGEMSIGEVGGGTTATELGVRSLDVTTSLADFNGSLGVQIVDGSVDPLTGLPDPARDLDFRVTTKDGTTFDVDLDPLDTTVQDVLDAINAAAAGAGLTVGVDFEATLVPDGNGIQLTDNTPPVGGTTTVEALNGSFAARDLGILGSSTSATFAGEDRAKVAVESLFSHLIALRDALLANDERGITLAGGKIETDVTRVSEARAEAGVRSRRVTDATTREEDQRIQDMSLRSQIQDLDYTEAAIRFSLLQQQLQAGLTTASRLANLSLLDFLG